MSMRGFDATAAVSRRRVIKAAGALTAGAGLFSIIGRAQAAETLKFAHIFDPSQPFHKWAEWAGAQIAERTGGRYAVRVFASSSLGGESDIYQSLTLGALDMGFTGTGTTSRAHGPMALISAPYMFRDFQHWSAFRDSEMQRAIAEEFTKKTGIAVMASVYYGLRHVTSNRTIHEPDDMARMKLRVPNVPLYLLFPRAVGANPTPITFAEVYLALQNGTVDGQENPLPTILAQKFHEVQSNIALTGHMIDTLVAMASKAFWNKLDPKDRELFAEVFQQAMAKCADDVRAEEARLVEEFRTKHGKTIDEVNRDAFRQKLVPALTGSDMPWTKADYDKVQSIT